MKAIETIRTQLENLKGAKVQIFGQATTLPSDYDQLTIDSLDVLDALSDWYDYDLNDLTSEEIEYLLSDDERYQDALSDNSYNWNSPLSNHINFNCYKDTLNGTYIYEVKFHLYGDVRGNYSDVVYLSCDTEYDFLDTIMNVTAYFTLEVDGDLYNISLDPLSEYVRICNDAYDFELYASDIEELTEEIRKEVTIKC
jgi:hypothetical protein